MKKNIRRLSAYQAKEIPCRVKLDANESPYGFPGALEAVRRVETNRYPDPEAGALRSLLASRWGVRADQVLHGNGSDELIYSLTAVFGGPVLFPVPTFSMYGIIAVILGEKAVSVPLDADFGLDTDRMLRAVRKTKPHLVFLSTPNNPTGNSFDRDAVVSIIRGSKGIVVVDEAYHPFSANESYLGLLRKCPNLVIMKTLSKTGLAALRTGFIIADRRIIAEVNKVRLPFNVNALSQAVALRALEDPSTLDAVIAAIRSERERLLTAMARLTGVTPYPSDANFILFRVDKAEKVHARLLKKGVLVRNLTDAIRDCLRVTVGTPEENRAFLEALEAITGKS